MRLARVAHGHTIPQKLLLTMIRVFSGFPAPDVVKTLLYRKPFFGGPHSELTQEVMRGPSDWSVGQRELFAAFISRLSQCPFRTGAHAAVAAQALGDKALTQKVLDDYTTAPIDEKLRATLGYLRKLCLTPEDVTSADVKPLLALGLSKQAIADAMYVLYLFSVYTRLADTLGWALPPDAGHIASAKSLLSRGYKL